MDNFLKKIEEAYNSWPGTVTQPHNLGGRTLIFKDTIIAHYHFQGILDLLFTKKVKEVLVKEGLVSPHHILPNTGWVSFYLRKSKDPVRNALVLLRLSYLSNGSAHIHAFGSEGKETMKRELEKFSLSPPLTAALLEVFASDRKQVPG